MATLTKPRTWFPTTPRRRGTVHPFSGEHSRLCRNGREQAQKEGSAGHGGDAAAVSSANSYSSDTSSLRTRAQERWVTRLRDFVDTGGKIRGDQTRISGKVVLREYLSDVCGEVGNDEQHKNQYGLLASVTDSSMTPSPALTRARSSSLGLKELGRARPQRRRSRRRRRRLQAETADCKTATSESAARKTGVQEVPVPAM